jgi:hypothetical protein
MLAVGQPVEVSAQESFVVLKGIGEPKLTGQRREPVYKQIYRYKGGVKVYTHASAEVA